jgi:hypothetical protein
VAVCGSFEFGTCVSRLSLLRLSLLTSATWRRHWEYAPSGAAPSFTKFHYTLFDNCDHSRVPPKIMDVLVHMELLYSKYPNFQIPSSDYWTLVWRIIYIRGEQGRISNLNFASYITSFILTHLWLIYFFKNLPLFCTWLQ